MLWSKWRINGLHRSFGTTMTKLAAKRRRCLATSLETHVFVLLRIAAQDANAELVCASMNNYCLEQRRPADKIANNVVILIKFVGIRLRMQTTDRHVPLDRTKAVTYIVIWFKAVPCHNYLRAVVSQLQIVKSSSVYRHVAVRRAFDASILHAYVSEFR